MAGGREFDKARLGALILYISKKLKDDPHFDMEKLNNILFIIDFRAYKELGKSITGATYVREPDVQR
jgi:hypothetical protein